MQPLFLWSEVRLIMEKNVFHSGAENVMYCKQCQENGGGWECFASTEAALMLLTAETFMSRIFRYSLTAHLFVCLKLSKAVSNDQKGQVEL